MTKPGKAVTVVTMDGKYLKSYCSLILYILLHFWLLKFLLKLFLFVCFFKGRYDLSMPYMCCEVCKTTWTAGVDDLIGSNYWPATLQFSTVYATDVFISFKEMKMAAPGISFQAFLRMLDRRTAHFGRVSVSLSQPTLHLFVSNFSWLNSSC